jgi:ring-1,2-phenylacetyl-CoA epoxidase subunit PaaC
MTPALQDLLFRLADDELLMGHRNSEWTGIAPIIEEDIAFSSIAQDEMGHAQAYYSLLHDHFNQPIPDQLAFARTPEAFRNAELVALPRADWGQAIMRQFLYDAAEQVRHTTYSSHPFTPLAHLSRKIAGEEKYHFMHGRLWIIKLGHGTTESREHLQIALDSLWPLALGLFETPQGDDQPSPWDEHSLRSAWLTLVCPILTEAGVEVPAHQTTEGQWQTEVEITGSRYSAPTQSRIELLEAMQMVYRIDPSAEW